MKTRYKVALGSRPTEITGGRPVAPGEFVSLDDDEQANPHNKHLIDAGVLLEAPTKQQQAKKHDGGDS